MVVYDVELNEEEIRALKGLFNRPPYLVQSREFYQTTSVCIGSPSFNIPILSYTAETINLHHGILSDLSPSQVKDIKERLGKIDSLTQLVQDEL